MTVTIQPFPNAIWAPTRNTIITPSAMPVAGRIDRRSAAIGAARPTPTISRTLTHHGTSRSGKPSSAVRIDWAWISGPGISTLRVVEVLCWSCSDVAVPPTTTTLPRTAAGSNVLWRMSM